MGNRERQQREREAMRRAILDAARELFVKEGYRNVSVRKIAERIEYSGAAIYSYFPSKDAIFFALAEEGFRHLDQALTRAGTTGGNPLDVLRQGFWEYYQFSKGHPEHFELMFADRSVPRIMEDWARFGFLQTTVQKASDQIRACVERGDFPPDTVPEVAFHILWAAMHGVALIGLYGMFAPGEDPDALARDTFEAALAGLRTGIRTTFAAANLSTIAGSVGPAGATHERP
jgi:AcrR family transcriptional regulator